MTGNPIPQPEHYSAVAFQNKPIFLAHPAKSDKQKFNYSH
jgi:hypothetical protein